MTDTNKESGQDEATPLMVQRSPGEESSAGSIVFDPELGCDQMATASCYAASLSCVFASMISMCGGTVGCLLGAQLASSLSDDAGKYFITGGIGGALIGGSCTFSLACCISSLSLSRCFPLFFAATSDHARQLHERGSSLLFEQTDSWFKAAGNEFKEFEADLADMTGPPVPRGPSGYSSDSST